jgi:hypothetical protein
MEFIDHVFNYIELTANPIRKNILPTAILKEKNVINVVRKIKTEL